MSPEQRVMKMNKLQLCLIFLRYVAEKECYAKAKVEYKGCSEPGCSKPGCGMNDHHRVAIAMECQAHHKDG